MLILGRVTDATALTFPVCSFKRVFDTHPLREVLTLSDLVACFRRFELKPQLLASIERELIRIDRALEHALDPASTLDKRATAIREAGQHAPNPTLAMQAKAEELRIHAKKDAKRDLRLWSPAVYRPDATERGGDGVSHVSCLVLDYDSGTKITEALPLWQDWFHLIHTTWSHTPQHPKFRVILPLAVPVPASEWEAMWAWAERQSEGEIDASMKGVAATYALPAVANPSWPRDAMTCAGPILDPRDLGLKVGTPLRLPVTYAGDSPLMGDPEKDYLIHEPKDAVYVYDDLEWDDDFERQSVLADEPVFDGRARGASSADSAKSTASSSDEAPDRKGDAVALDDSANQELDEAEDSTEDYSTVLDATEIHTSTEEPDDDVDSSAHARSRKMSSRGRGRRRETLCLDFDGVIHSYTSGWRGATSLPDPPVPGALEWIATMIDHYDIVIHSTRGRESGAHEAMRQYLIDHGLSPTIVKRIRFPRQKPPARVYIDDRGFRFEGSFPSLDEIARLVPWNRR